MDDEKQAVINKQARQALAEALNELTGTTERGAVSGMLIFSFFGVPGNDRVRMVGVLDEAQVLGSLESTKFKIHDMLVALETRNEAERMAAVVIAESELADLSAKDIQ